MPEYLLDTSVYLQPLRRKPVLKALERWQALGDSRCAVSRVSVGEVEWGLHYEGNPVRWKKYESLLQNRLQVFETGAGLWAVFAKMKARQQLLGEPVSDLDLLIAATAKEQGLTVATLNSRDFSRIEGLAWENWSL
jgi:tRNA(fMet)-specific endonuclease VapC